MDIQNETLRNIILSEYALGLAGDTEFFPLLGERRVELVAYVENMGTDYFFIGTVMDTIFAALSSTDLSREAVRIAFVNECASIGFAQADIVMDMVDAIYEVRIGISVTVSKHEQIAPTISTLTGVYKALAIVYYRMMLRICLNMHVFTNNSVLVKNVITGMRNYISSDIDAYNIPVPMMFTD